MYKKTLGYYGALRNRARMLPRYSSGLSVPLSAGIRRGVRNMQRQGRSMTLSRRRYRPRGSTGVTTQHDSKFIYAKRNMPRRKKRVWKRFMKKVHAISEKELGTRSVVFNTSQSSTITNDTLQVLQAITLYGNSSTASYNNDLRNIGNLENTGNPTATDDATIDDTTKFLFQSGVLDITIANRSVKNVDVGGNTVEEAASEAKLEVDLYEIIVRKNARDATGNFNSLLSLIQDGELAKTIAGAATLGGQGMDLDLRGVTPFDLPMSLSRFGIKILKKTKYFIPNGDTVTYQMRDPGRHVFARRELTQGEGFNYPGVTRCVLLVGKLIPGLTVGSLPGYYKARITTGMTRKYMYKVEGINETRDAYFPL